MIKGFGRWPCEKRLYKKNHDKKGSHHWTAEKNPRWNNGKSLTVKGYREFRGKERILEHRKIMQDYLERKLSFDECVHHINGNKMDNRIENLVVLSRSEHSKLHRRN